MARGFSKAVTFEQKQTDSLPSMNLLNTSFLEHLVNLNNPRIERSKEHLLKDVDSSFSTLFLMSCKQPYQRIGSPSL
jgi:hypothetical protein